MKQVEPHLHGPLFALILNEEGPLSAEDLGARIAHLPKKQHMAIPWIRSARDAGVVQRATQAEERDQLGRQTGPRLYELTPAGEELLAEMHRLTLVDGQFLPKLEGSAAGKTAAELADQDSELAVEYVEIWMESAYGRGLVQRTERGDPMRVALTAEGERRLQAVS